MAEEILIEIARIERELQQRVAAKLASQQRGEAFKDLPKK